MFIRSTGEPVLVQVVGHSEHGDAYRRITYDHDGKTVLHDRASVRRLSLPRAPSLPRPALGVWSPRGGLGDRHLVTIPRGGGGGPSSLGWGTTRGGGCKLLYPPPCVQRMPCPTNTSIRTVFFEDIISYMLNYVPGFRIKVSS